MCEQEKYRLTDAGRAYTPADGDVYVQHRQCKGEEWREWFVASNLAVIPAIENSRCQWRVMCGGEKLAFRDGLHVASQYPDKAATMPDSLPRNWALEAEIKAFEEALWLEN